MTPPQSLDDLKGLTIDIARGVSELRLGKRALKLLAALVEEPRFTALNAISALAETYGVNPSTLTRLAQRLGYEGFGGLQDVFRRHLADEGHFYSRRAGLLKAGGSTSTSADLNTRIVEEELRNISTMTENLDALAIGSAAQALATAHRVRTYGLRQSASVAEFVSYALGMLRRDVAVLGSPQHGVAHGLSQLEQGDVLVLVGSAPYTRGTIAAARVASIHGITVIAITDSHASPLAAHADHAFITPTGGSFFSNCMASAVVLIEVLLSAVAQQLDQSAVSALEQREAMIEELDVQLKP